MPFAGDLTRFICLFHSDERAERVVAALQDAGVARDAISTLRAGTTGDAETLADIGVPERDRQHLQDGLRGGGVVISLEAPESQSHSIEKIFHHYSADKIDEAEFEPTKSLAGETAALTVPAEDSYSATKAVGGEAVIPVVQEELHVGKRAVDRGGVRVFQRTVEEPVQQDVNLHAERVVLEYREVNRPVTEADLRRDPQGIELIETAEVPVVEKVARVVEEVHVGKVETDRTEVVNDTVRHTEVDVEPVDAADQNIARDGSLR